MPLNNQVARIGKNRKDGVAWRASFGVGAAALALLAFAGCRQGEGGGNPIAAIAQTLRATDIQGKWQSGCVRASRIWGYEKKRIELVGQTSFISTTAYGPTDGNCETPIAELEERGTFETGGGSPGGNNIQFLIQRIGLRASNPAGVTLLNSVNVCEVNDWRVGDLRDITAATQQGSLTCWDKTPRTLYDIYTIEGTTMFLGQGNARDKEGPDKRPTRLDRDMPFQKQ